MRRFFTPMTMQQRVERDLLDAQRSLYDARAELESAQHHVNFCLSRVQRLNTELRALQPTETEKK